MLENRAHVLGNRHTRLELAHTFLFALPIHADQPRRQIRQRNQLFECDCTDIVRINQPALRVICRRHGTCLDTHERQLQHISRERIEHRLDGYIHAVTTNVCECQWIAVDATDEWSLLLRERIMQRIAPT